MDIKRSGSQPSGKGPADWFTGTVRLDPLFSPPDPARSPAHSSPSSRAPVRLGTPIPLVTLLVTSGLGWVQRQGGQVEEIRPGDVVWFPPGEKHWHGASASAAMSHIAIQERLDGNAVDWLEPVTDADYQPPRA